MSGTTEPLRGDSFTPFPRVASGKGQDTDATSEREKPSSWTLSVSGAPMITFAPHRERRRCRSARGATFATYQPTMRELYLYDDEEYRTRGENTLIADGGAECGICGQGGAEWVSIADSDGATAVGACSGCLAKLKAGGLCSVCREGADGEYHVITDASEWNQENRPLCSACRRAWIIDTTPPLAEQFDGERFGRGDK